MNASISLDKNTLTINDKTYKAQKCKPGECVGCAFSLPGGCDLHWNGIEVKLNNSTWCTFLHRPDDRSIIWKEEVKT